MDQNQQLQLRDLRDKLQVLNKSRGRKKGSNLNLNLNLKPKKKNSSYRIIVIGDLHGDMDATIRSLLVANVIKIDIIKGKVRTVKKIVWTGGSTIVVQLGDQIDRKNRTDARNDENSEMRIIKLFDCLNRAARKSGGAVYSILGNHELMNVAGDFSYVSSKGMQGFGGVDGRRKSFEPGSQLAKYLARNRYSILKIEDWLFVHAGVSREIANNYSIRFINSLVRSYLVNNFNPKYANAFREIVESEDGIFWIRTYGEGRYKTEDLKYVLERYGCKRMAIGHTPQNKIMHSKDGSLWLLDTGMSRAFGSDSLNRVQVLEIIKDIRGKEKISILK